MGTDLAVAPEDFTIATASGADDLIEANLGGMTLTSKDLPWAKIPTGGSTTWTWRTVSGEEFTAKKLIGVLAVVGKTTHTLWPHTDAATGSKPLLVSRDLKVAEKIGDDFGDIDPNIIAAAKRPDGLYDVKKIPYFHWEGSGPGARPPRAKSSRVLGIIRANERMPIFVRVSQTSLRAVDTLLRGLTLDGLFHYGALVELSLEKKKGQRADYAVLVAKKIGEIPAAAAAAIKTRFTDVYTEIVAPSGPSNFVESDSMPF